jgi:hypothetical protein
MYSYLCLRNHINTHKKILIMEFTTLVQFCNLLNIQYETKEFKDIANMFSFTHHDTLYIFGKMEGWKWYQCSNQNNNEIKEFISDVIRIAR